MWRMFHKDNAIEAMAISVRYAEPIGALLAKRVLAALDHPSSEAGLIDKRPVQGFQINMANPGDVRPVSGGAMLFQKVSLEKDWADNVQSVLTKQVQCDPTHITYQTWRYTRWEQELKSALGLLVPAIKLASQGVGIGAIRVEYLDRFFFDGESAEASPRTILTTGSPWIAPHVFDAPDLWHSHTGKFASVSAENRCLLMVHADFQDLTVPDPNLAGRRSLLLTTAGEVQYANSGYEVSSEDLENFLSSVLTDLHDEALKLFKEVVDHSFRKAQGLPHD